jgi:dCTP diphosphatase
VIIILFTINYSLFTALIGQADTLIYLIRLADKLDINLITAAQSKIEVNERKYPVEKVKGSAEKYTVYV